MARVQLMFNKRDTESALTVRAAFSEVGQELRGDRGDKCLAAAHAIQEALVALGRLEVPNENEVEDFGLLPNGEPAKEPAM